MSKITLLLQCLEDEYTALQTVVELYKTAADPNQPPTEEHALRSKLSALQEVYQNIMQIYREATKPEKKEILAEMDELKQRANFRILKQQAEYITMGLKARLHEISTQLAIVRSTFDFQ
ncbi:hypothetical protein Q1695_009639 [Nippostrongylus brasiliensis]|nr:hypothetical protein Q1695_009639 [Nippostrongylus brasiliensis]